MINKILRDIINEEEIVAFVNNVLVETISWSCVKDSELIYTI